MKRILTIWICIVCGYVSVGQTFDEWFKQKKTQIKYLVNQIAALEVYADYVEKGYKTVQNGNSFINDLKHGEFNLHSGYFSSLMSVSPAIKNAGNVTDIVRCQMQTENLLKSLAEHSGKSTLLTSSEQKYIQQICAAQMDAARKDSEELMSVLEDNQFQMKDDERIERISHIGVSTNDRYCFVQSFVKKVTTLEWQRIEVQHSVDNVKSIHSTK